MPFILRNSALLFQYSMRARFFCLPAAHRKLLGLGKTWKCFAWVGLCFPVMVPTPVTNSWPLHLNPESLSLCSPP